MGTAYSMDQSEKPDVMPKYRWTRVLYWCAGRVRRAVYGTGLHC